MKHEMPGNSFIGPPLTAGLAALLAALAWLAGPPALAQDDSVRISAAELQRMVYSAHLLTQFETKPELDAGLQVLLELQRRNPQADPAALAELTRQTLQVYRTNTPAFLRSQGFRDEILAAYLDALRQAPARTNFVPATLQLFNWFMLGPGDYATASAAELVHAGNQRLLSAERAPAQREALVEACAARGAGNAAFGRALDGVLGPELGMLLAHTPAQILGLNPALSNRPTMQTLLGRSLASGDGSVTISTNELKGLFTQEMATMHQVINTNLAMQRAMILGQGDFASYLTNTVLVQSNVQWEATVNQGQAARLDSAYAAANTVSTLSASKISAIGKAMGGLSKGVKCLADGLKGTGQAWSEASCFGKMVTCGNFVAGGLAIVGSVMEFAGLSQDPNDVIMEEIGQVKDMINDLSTNMNYRFDRVDQSLDRLGQSMDEVLDRLAYSINLIGEVGHDVNQVRQGLVDVQTDLHRLERHLESYLRELSARNLKEDLNLYLGYEATYGMPMSYNTLPVPYYVYGENKFFTHARDLAADQLSSPYQGRDYSAAGLLNELTESGGATISNRLDQNLSYLKQYLNTQLGQSTAGPLPLPNPRDWFVGTYAYLQLAAENPMYFRRVNVSNRLDLMTRPGCDLTNFLRSLTFDVNGTNINRPLHNALLANYTNKLGGFVSQVRTTEQRYASLTNFALDTWRAWSVGAPRMTAGSAQVRASDPYVPLVGLPNPVTKLAAGEHHCLALRSDGTVVGWGDNGSRQITIPANATNVVAMAAGRGHSLVLRADGTVVCWGDNFYGQTNVTPGLTGVVAVAAGAYHNLALRSDHTVVGWGYGGYGQTAIPAGLTNVVAIAAGGFHSLALRADGTVVCWGLDMSGQVSVPAGLSNVVAIAGGGSHSLALRADGTVAYWGDSYGQDPPLPAGLNNVAAISAGGSHSIALRSNGTVTAWGYNYAGQTRVPTGLSQVVAIGAGAGYNLALRADGAIIAWGDTGYGQCAVPSLLTWQRAISGRDHHLALKENGTVTGWGQSTYGERGVGSPANLTNAVAVAAGGTHSLALRADGTVTGWGNNTYGQITIPGGLSGVVAVAAGWNHSLALRANGTVAAWGYNNYGQINVPAGLANVVAIAAGYNHSLALRTNGTVVGWGNNNTDGGPWVGQATVPAGLSNVVAIAAGNDFSLALRADGTVVGWGGNMDGQTNTSGLNSIVAIAAGYFHGLALRADGAVLSWGSYGPQVIANNVIAIVAGDDGDTFVRPDGAVLLRYSNLWDPSKTTVPALPPGITKVAAGYDQSLVLLADGTITAFGGNGYGDCTPPAGLNNVVDIAAGFYFSLALRADGTVVAWGDPRFGRTSVPAGLNNAVAIAAGTFHGLALRADGTVIGWGGQNPPWNVGQEIPPAGLRDVVAVAAGFCHSLALKANGTVVAWGTNNYGQTTIPAGLNNVVAIAAGPNHNLALLANGQVVAWGPNDAGQTDVPPAARSNVVAIAAGGYHNLALRQDGMIVSWGGQGVSRFPVPPGLSNVVALAAGYYHSLFLTASPGSAPSAATFTLRQIPTRVGNLLAGAADAVAAELGRVGSLRSATLELSGAKALCQAVLELGMPYTMERDDVLHGCFYGSEGVMDLGVATNVFSAESSRMVSTPKARPLVLDEVVWGRLTCFTNRLNDRLNDLAATGQPELPRLLGHTLRLCNLLRDAWAVTPPPALEIWRQTNAPSLLLYGEPYVKYHLSYSDELGMPGWQPTSLTNLVNQQTFRPPVASGPRRFYRAGVYAP